MLIVPKVLLVLLKKDEYVFDCSDIDDIITFQKDGTMKVVKVEAKTFIGKNIEHVGIFKKRRQTYGLQYDLQRR